ncbi:MAG: RNA polymerase sigma factor [Lachnospiraceae bacterium]
MDEMRKVLVERMKAGDSQAFDQLYHQYAKKLYRTAYLISGNKEDSEDILQEAFVTCYVRCSTIQNPESFESWLSRILVRTAWRILKKKKRTVSVDELMEQEATAGIAEAVFTDQKSLNPLEQVVSSEYRSALFQAVCRLDVKLKTVLILYYYEERSIREIADITGSFEGTVKSRLFTAREKLKRELVDSDIQVRDVRRTVQ